MKCFLSLMVFITSMLAGVSAAIGQPATLADLAKYRGRDREQLLYEGAKKEGKVVWYTSLVSHKDIAGLFEKKYPGVTLEVYRTTGKGLVTRVIAEASSSRVLVDAIETSPGPLMLLRESELLMPYTSPYLDRYPTDSLERAPGGLVYWTTDRESYIGVGYNKKALPPSAVPHSFDDLLKPALRGKMSMVGGESGARALAGIIKAKGEAFVRNLKKQEITLHALSAMGLNALVATGEVPITFTSIHSNIRRAAEKGAPVDWIPMDLVVTNAGGASVFAHAQHPHGALLFIDFLLGPDGQQMLEDKLGYGSPVKQYGFKRWYPERGLSTAGYAKKIDRWTRLIAEITGK
jgi:iron(III) transport system substrate-binding protein